MAELNSCNAYYVGVPYLLVLCDRWLKTIYKKLVCDGDNSLIFLFSDAERIDQLLMGALLLNPDVTVLWNMRRELPNLEPQFELHFTSVILTRKPKSSEVFNYRKWLIKKLLDGKVLMHYTVLCLSSSYKAFL